jgi:hypothetical protein
MSNQHDSGDFSTPRQAPGSQSLNPTTPPPPRVLAVGARWATADGEAWGNLAVPLARAVIPRYVNTFNHRGGYNSLRRRGRKYIDENGNECEFDKVTTRKRRVAFSTVVGHFEAGLVRPRHTEGDHLIWRPTRVVGFHAINPADDTSLWTTHEVDAHDGPADNLDGMLAEYERLRSFGLWPVLWTSDDKGGLHQDILYAHAVPSHVAYAFGQWLEGKALEFGLPAKGEGFPKQPFVKDRMPFGSWCRLFGPHHTRDIWCKVYDGRRWLEGTEAALYVIALLSRGGDDPKLLPQEVLDLAAEILAADQAGQAETRAPRGDGEPRRPRTVRVEVPGRDGVPRGGGGEGDGTIGPGGRYPFLSKVCVAMRHDGATDDEILARLRDINAKRCRPMKDDAELVEIVRGVAERHAKGVKEICVRFGKGWAFFRMTATADDLAPLVADDPDLRPTLDDLARRGAAGEDVRKGYDALADELRRRQTKREAEEAARREQTPEARARRKFAEKCEREHSQRLRETGQRREQERAGGTTAPGWASLRSWLNDFRRRHLARLPRCGKTTDHRYVSRDDRHDQAVGSPPCGRSGRCDFCFGRARVDQVARVVACLLQRSPPLGGGVNPADPEAGQRKAAAVERDEASPDDPVNKFCRTYAETNPDEHHYWAPRMYHADHRPEDWPARMRRDPGTTFYRWEGKAGKALKAAQQRHLRAVRGENGRRFDAGEEPLRLGGVVFIGGSRHDPLAHCVIISEVEFAGTVPVTLGEAVREVIRLGDGLGQRPRNIERLAGWRKMYDPPLYDDVGTVDKAGDDTPDAELDDRQTERYGMTLAILLAAGCIIVEKAKGKTTGLETFLPGCKVEFKIPERWGKEELELLDLYLCVLREVPPETLDKIGKQWREAAARDDVSDLTPPVDQSRHVNTPAGGHSAPQAPSGP